MVEGDEQRKSFKSQLRLEKTSKNPRLLSQLMALAPQALWEIAELLVQADTEVLLPKDQRIVVAALITLCRKIGNDPGGQFGNPRRVQIIRKDRRWSDNDGYEGGKA